LLSPESTRHRSTLSIVVQMTGLVKYSQGTPKQIVAGIKTGRFYERPERMGL